MQDFFLHFFVQFLHLVTYAKEYFTVKFVKKKFVFGRMKPIFMNFYIILVYNYKHDFDFEGILFNLPKYLGHKYLK